MNENSKKKSSATFTIQVQFQQNCTWQGIITWAEGGKSQKFRSELEMIKLMMEAIPPYEEEEEEQLNTWL